jgi:hypothetical protein
MTTQPHPHAQPPAQRAWLWPSLAPLPLLLAFLLPLPRNGAIAGLPPVCMFHLTTGLPCPGCGLTRSVVSCTHGHWSEAFTYHPLGPLVFAAFIAMAALGLLSFISPRPVQHLIESVTNKRRMVLWLTSATGVVLIGIWVARLAGWLPSPPYWLPS